MEIKIKVIRFFKKKEENVCLYVDCYMIRIFYSFILLGLSRIKRKIYCIFIHKKKYIGDSYGVLLIKDAGYIFGTINIVNK